MAHPEDECTLKGAATSRTSPAEVFEAKLLPIGLNQ
jgi:hypothetical protein